MRVSLAVLILLGVVVVNTAKVNRSKAQEDVTPQPISAEIVESTNDSEPVLYQYVAQRGDSYSVLARKAIQTYGIETNTSLSGAQIIFAETKLTQENGSPFLDLGENVSIAQSQVKGWVDAALQLTDEQEARWDYYAQFTNFNTDSAGESS